MERLALPGEDAGEKLVVLEAQSLYSGDETFEPKGDGVAEDEHDDGGRGGRDALPPQGRRRSPHNEGQRRVHQPEGRETGK